MTHFAELPLNSLFEAGWGLMAAGCGYSAGLASEPGPIVVTTRERDGFRSHPAELSLDWLELRGRAAERVPARSRVKRAPLV